MCSNAVPVRAVRARGTYSCHNRTASQAAVRLLCPHSASLILLILHIAAVYCFQKRFDVFQLAWTSSCRALRACALRGHCPQMKADLNATPRSPDYGLAFSYIATSTLGIVICCLRLGYIYPGSCSRLFHLATKTTCFQLPYIRQMWLRGSAKATITDHVYSSGPSAKHRRDACIVSLEPIALQHAILLTFASHHL